MERESYYYTLRLQPGASTAEIKSAFRRLVKLYHPDHDQSLDAEVKYREIQTAYKELLKKPFIGNTVSNAPSGANYQQQTAQAASPGWQTESGQSYTSQTTWKPTNLTDEFIDDNRGTLLEEALSFNLILAILGSLPLLLLESVWYLIIGVILIGAAYFGSLHLYVNRHDLFRLTTAGRIAFWISLVISTGLCFFTYLWTLTGFLFVVILCLIALFVPVPWEIIAKILMINTRFMR